MMMGTAAGAYDTTMGYDYDFDGEAPPPGMT